MGGDRALLKNMLDFFHEDAPEYLAKLHEGLERGDVGRVQHAAHSLKGLAANFGGEAAGLAAQRIEELGRRGDLLSASQAVEKLEVELSRLSAALVRESADL